MDTIKFGVPDNIIFFQKETIRSSSPLELSQMYYVLQMVSLTYGRDRTWFEHQSAQSLAARNQVGYWNSLWVCMRWSFHSMWYDPVVWLFSGFASRRPIWRLWNSSRMDSHWTVVDRLVRKVCILQGTNYCLCPFRTSCNLVYIYNLE